METIYIFSERLSGPATRSDQNLNKNGDREETLVEPVDVPFMLIASGDKSTKIPSGRKGLFKRFRGCAGKRLRVMCCGLCWPQRDQSSCQKNAHSVEIIDNIDNEPSDKNPAQKTNDEVERNIKIVNDPMIITNEPNTKINSTPIQKIIAPTSVSSVLNIGVNSPPFKEYTEVNVEIECQSNENDDNTKLQDDKSAEEMPSDIVQKRKEHDSVNKAEMLIFENQHGDLQTIKPKRQLAIAYQNESVLTATEVTHRLENKYNPIRKPRYDNENVSASTESTSYRIIGYARNVNERRIHEKPDQVFKYWKMRYDLFSKFDDGIMLDRESFYSVCPEIISQYIADGCVFNVGIDPFCGAGGNLIQLAIVCKSVIAIDIDPDKIKLAKHNARLYGVEDKITFVVGDFFTMGERMKADVLVTSPPWGGPGYQRKRVFPLADLCQNNGGGESIMRIAKSIAPRVILHLPKNICKVECIRLGDNFNKIKLEEIYLNDRLNCVVAYYCSFDKWYINNNDEVLVGVFQNDGINPGGRRGKSHVCKPKVTNIEVRLCSKRNAIPYKYLCGNMVEFKSYMAWVNSFMADHNVREA